MLISLFKGVICVMAYVSTFFIIVVIGYICYRMFKRKSTPSNRYTPFDEITMGNKINVKHDAPIHDTKHHIKYEERTDNDKTV
jgi:predicted thioesterase